MPKKTNSAAGHKNKNMGGDALQSLLSDQAEARVQREISISRNEAGESSDAVSGKSSSGTSDRTGSQVRGISSDSLRPPSMRETKAQLIGRMEKLLSEMHKLEARLEQKDLEREKIEKDKKALVFELEGVRNEKSALEKELSRKDEINAFSLDSQQALEKKVQDLEEENREISLEVQKYEQSLSDLENVNQELQSRVHEMSNRIKGFAAAEEDFKTRLSSKDKKVHLLNQEILMLQQENKKVQDQASAGKKEEPARQMQMGAEDWRQKAGALWDGQAYAAPQKAIGYLNAALELRPDWPEALNDRGLAYLDDYQLDKSLEDFTTAIALKGDFAEAYHNRGVALLRAGKRFAAKKDFQIAAGHGLWLGLNALSAPSKGPGLVDRIKKLLGLGRSK